MLFDIFKAMMTMTYVAWWQYERLMSMNYLYLEHVILLTLLVKLKKTAKNASRLVETNDRLVID